MKQGAVHGAYNGLVTYMVHPGPGSAVQCRSVGLGFDSQNLRDSGVRIREPAFAKPTARQALAPPNFTA
jgi:hypothetical protein